MIKTLLPLILATSIVTAPSIQAKGEWGIPMLTGMAAFLTLFSGYLMVKAANIYDCTHLANATLEVEDNVYTCVAGNGVREPAKRPIYEAERNIFIPSLIATVFFSCVLGYQCHVRHEGNAPL